MGIRVPTQAAWLLLPVLFSCNHIDPSARTVVLDDLEHQSTQDGLWESAAWDTPWLPFPGKQAITIEHGLGRTPRLVQVYVAFDDGDCDRDATSSALLASGTLARISRVNDATITVRNDSGATYCVRVVAQ